MPRPFSGNRPRLLSTLVLVLATTGCIAKKRARVGQNANQVTTSVALGPSDWAHNLFGQSNFEDGLSAPWTLSFSPPARGTAKVENGAYCMHVENKGANKWDAQVRHRELGIEKGHRYKVSFRIWSDQPTRVSAKIGMMGPPYQEYWVKVVNIGPQPTTITDAFSMTRDSDLTAEFALHYGGGMAFAKEPFVVCIDDVVLSDPEFSPKPKPKAVRAPKIGVNQLGYFPNAAKFAAYPSDSPGPLKWELLDAELQVVASGDSFPFGNDPAAGEAVHLVDFSSFTNPGRGYRMTIGDELSFPFDIGKELYQKLKYDALHYFYHNRSGIEIKLPYAEDAKWTRPAGHSTGDRAVTCGFDVPCDYKLDVTGGWYDAGDHGKYVVNGGIAVWTLLNLWERAKFLGDGKSEFADGKLNIPENSNGVPDLLDEVRWELEWMMKMQVPKGNPKAGMVHHKVHDNNWTELGIAPHEAEKKMLRYLRPPSTAATLNLAAVGAQCARVWKGIDDAFAKQCLQASEKAWGAAKANPSVYAPASDTIGGGPYDDADVSDEFYWAAAELAVTTHKEEYKRYVISSPHHAEFRMDSGGAAASMTWRETDTLGKISMAIVPSGANVTTLNQMRMDIADAADEYLAALAQTGYNVPFKPSAGGKYPWGSNSFIVNNAIILALANDFTGQRKYFDGAFDAMGYLLGRNPLGQSYVTGYGSKPLQWPHHRFWAFQVDRRFPSAPPGCLSGGPNSGLEDPYVQAVGLSGCAAQKCFVDNIAAFSVNEVTINWNAPMAWLASFLAEKGPMLTASEVPVKAPGKGAAGRRPSWSRKPAAAKAPKRKR